MPKQAPSVAAIPIPAPAATNALPVPLRAHAAISAMKSHTATMKAPFSSPEPGKKRKVAELLMGRMVECRDHAKGYVLGTYDGLQGAENMTRVSKENILTGAFF
jgi:hypothetical protein